MTGYKSSEMCLNLPPLQNGCIKFSGENLCEIDIFGYFFPPNKYCTILHAIVVHNKFQFQMCVWVVARLPQRLKSTFFENFSSIRFPFRDPPLKIFLKTLILAFEVIEQPPKHTFEIGIYTSF